MGLGARVGVYVVLQGGDGLEAALADAALVRPLLRVRLHVPGQQVALVADVVAVVAHVRLRYRLRGFPLHHFGDLGLVVLGVRVHLDAVLLVVKVVDCKKTSDG